MAGGQCGGEAPAQEQETGLRGRPRPLIAKARIVPKRPSLAGSDCLVLSVIHADSNEPIEYDLDLLAAVSLSADLVDHISHVFHEARLQGRK